jgi:dihydrofolate synthase/folylpolyglutamate synthase
MGSPRAPCNLIVGGTNGKGSTVAFLEAMLKASGQRVGAYTSPHLLAYNERVRIDGHDATDAELCAAFERIEQVRGDTTLTYFEYGTLAALDLFARADVDVAVLEVGLGGRLDATNIIDADVAIVTTVGLDHQGWLGPDRDSIGAEKAGIARRGRPLVIGEDVPPQGMLETLQRIGASVQRNGIQFHVHKKRGVWIWLHEDGTRLELPYPHVDASVQVTNAASAIAALHALDGRVSCSPGAIAEGIVAARPTGRLQRLPGPPEIILDVAHNEQAARVLARWLDRHPAPGPVHAVFSALSDKDVPAILATLGARIAHWHLAGLQDETPRGQSATTLGFALDPAAPRDFYPNVATALRAARAARPARIVAFGSFFLVAAVMRCMNANHPGVT